MNATSAKSQDREVSDDRRNSEPEKLPETHHFHLCTRADRDAPESVKAIEKANESLRLSRFHEKEAKLHLSRAGLLRHSPKEIQDEFRKEEERECGKWYSDAIRLLMVDEMAEREECGLFYVNNAEIIFPPQVVREYGFHGVISLISDILVMEASRIEDQDPKRAADLREIAARYYPEEDDSEWELEDDDDDDDEVSGVAPEHLHS